MFYHTLVLGKKAPYAKLWLAAHYRKKLRKTDFLSVNVCQAVESLLETRIRLSLRTMSHLMVGVTIIHNKQTRYLLDDLEHDKRKAKIVFAIVDAPEAKLKARLSDINLPDVDQMIGMEPILVDTQKIVPQLLCPEVPFAFQREPNFTAIWKSFSDEFEDYPMEGPSIVINPGEIIFDDSIVTDDGFGGCLDKNPDDIFGPSFGNELGGAPASVESAADQPMTPLHQPIIEVFSPSTLDVQPQERQEQVEKGPADTLQPGGSEARPSLEAARKRVSRPSAVPLPDELVLEPVPEASHPHRKKKKVKNLVVDRQKGISKLEFNRRLENVSDTLTPRELLFVSKFKANLQVQSNVRYLLSNSCRNLLSQGLKQLYQERLTTGSYEDRNLEDEPGDSQEPPEGPDDFLHQPTADSTLRSPSRSRSPFGAPEFFDEPPLESERPRTRKKKSKTSSAAADDEKDRPRKKAKAPSTDLPSRQSESFRRASAFFDDGRWEMNMSELGPIPEDPYSSQIPSFSTQDRDSFIADLSGKSENVILFSSLMQGCRRREVAVKFFQLLVFHKQGIVKLVQPIFYGEIYIHKRENLDTQ